MTDLEQRRHGLHTMWREEAIVSARPDVADVRWVTTDTGDATSAPSWSPDGTQEVAQASDGMSIFSRTGIRLRILSRLGTEPAWQPLPR